MHPSDGRVVSNFIMQALQNHPITLGEGSQTRRFCYVDDLIDAFLRFMEAPDEVTGPINLGDPAEFTVRQLAGLVVEMTNSKSEIAHKKLPSDTIRGSERPISRSRRSI
jgi:UDP-glucuronate decarboxylase